MQHCSDTIWLFEIVLLSSKRVKEHIYVFKKHTIYNTQYLVLVLQGDKNQSEELPALSYEYTISAVQTLIKSRLNSDILSKEKCFFKLKEGNRKAKMKD